MKRLLITLLLALSLSSLPSASKSCDLALSLLMDVSGSVDAVEYRQQVEGTAIALASPRIIDRIMRGNTGVIYISVGMYNEDRIEVIPWTRVSNAEEARDLSQRLLSVQRPPGNATYTGAALNDAINSFANAPDDCTRYLVDVSTDDITTDKAALASAVERAGSEGIVVNALIILMTNDEIARRTAAGDTGVSNEALEDWARDNLRTGVGSFVHVTTFDNYGDAISRKLWAELASAE
jgi:Ca-activated chloride channel homolog